MHVHLRLLCHLGVLTLLSYVSLLLFIFLPLKHTLSDINIVLHIFIILLFYYYYQCSVSIAHVSTIPISAPAINTFSLWLQQTAKEKVHHSVLETEECMILAQSHLRFKCEFCWEGPL